MIQIGLDGGQWFARVSGLAGFGNTLGDALRALALAIDEEGIEI
ncbi:MAG: hypothetical protein PHS14_07600 [Elusimicrobia bacterium]|nr:hypothetical protein [Elusimicrobiota bacterium]